MKTIKIGAKVQTLPDGCIGTVVDIYDGEGETKAIIRYNGVCFSSPTLLKNIKVIEDE